MPSGSVVFSSRAPIGYVAIADCDLCTNQGFKSVVPFDMKMNEFLYYALIHKTRDVVSRATGTTFKEISGKGMAETIIPLPPLAEQKRIVEKLDSILPLIDSLTEST